MSASPDVETTILFTKPVGTSSLGIEVFQILLKLTTNIFTSDIPAGEIAEFLVGFSNKGSQDMIIETVEAAFHYPMDFSYVIQNFSAIQYAKIVKPQQQATVSYSFVPAEPFAGRPFGLSVSLGYKDAVSTKFH